MNKKPYQLSDAGLSLWAESIINSDPEANRILAELLDRYTKQSLIIKELTK